MFERKVSTKIEVLEVCIPKIVISQDAMIKMHHYTEICDKEIGWLGTAYKKDKEIYIDDVFLFEQEVHSTTTEITPEGLSEFGESLMKRDDGIEIWNNLKAWGHSHVNMGVSPSGQDDKQVETFSESGHDWFIRIITNKKGDLRIDLYEFNQGIIYNDIPWREELSKEEQEIMNMIEELENKLEEIEDKKSEKFKENIEKEIKEKVSKKQAQIKQFGYSYRDSLFDDELSSGYYNNYHKGYDKKNETQSEQESQTYEGKELVSMFDTHEILDIGECYNITEVNDVLQILGYGEILTYNEKLKLWELCQDLTTKYIYGNGMNYY